MSCSVGLRNVQANATYPMSYLQLHSNYYLCVQMYMYWYNLCYTDMTLPPTRGKLDYLGKLDTRV